VLLFDEEHRETLIRRVLPATEVRRHFPELDARASALAELRALAPTERAERLATLLGMVDGPVTIEDAEPLLRDLGPAAVSALLPLLDVRAMAWWAAIRLAEIGRRDDVVIHALHAALQANADQPMVAWALSHLGRLDLVLERIDSLPQNVVVRAVTAPYIAFHSRAATAPPLDYTPLTDVIERWPTYAPALEKLLRPGTIFCSITPGDVDTAIRALESPHAVIRQHAVTVVGDRALGRQIGTQVLPRLSQAIRTDADPTVRRLAILSLLCWQKDSRHLADAIREALRDPAAEVREAAAEWLRDQRVDEST
jgi:hypothetical protein